jgi:hypothetical protein
MKLPIHRHFHVARVRHLETSDSPPSDFRIAGSTASLHSASLEESGVSCVLLDIGCVALLGRVLHAVSALRCVALSLTLQFGPLGAPVARGIGSILLIVARSLLTWVSPGYRASPALGRSISAERLKEPVASNPPWSSAGSEPTKETTMTRDEHNKAAEHHENAAKAHRSAAEHHRKGDLAKGQARGRRKAAFSGRPSTQ